MRTVGGGYPGTLRPLWVVSGWLGRSGDTVREWYRNGLLEPKACDVATRALLVDLVDAQRLHSERPPRATRRGVDRSLRSA